MVRKNFLNQKQTDSRLLEKALAPLLPKELEKFKKPIHIHDSVWGDIKLEPCEASFLNTPLMQRLRRIKQLGGGHVLFPGATHTRFEHSLGVLEQAGRMCDGLKEGDETLVSDKDRHNLRFAALCHDIGHGPFSHYSEPFYNELQSFEGPYSDDDETSAENLSAVIVRSNAFKEFCFNLGNMYGVGLNQEFIAKAITGDLSDDQHYLGQIIHGPFDADKIDYLMRDGLYCGMPIRIDMQRIYRTLTTEYNKDKELCLTGEQGAVPALIQIVHHRQQMHAVVYLHHVARIFKIMLLKGLRCAQRDEIKIGKKRLTSVFDILSFDDEMLLAPGTLSNSKSATADLFNRLRERRLFKIAMEICPEKSDPDVLKRIEGCEKRKGKEFKDLENELMQLAEAIAKKAGLASHLVLFDLPKSISSNEANKMLVMQGGEPRELGKLVDIKKECESLESLLEQYLLCCPKEHVKKVQDVAQKHFGLRTV